MNKKGFTLTELLAVVVIIALLSTLAVPNIISMLNRSKNEKFVTDAKQVIAKAKYYYKNNKDNEITLSELGIDLGQSPYGNKYTNGKVEVKNNLGNLTYSIYLTDGTYCIGTSNEPKEEAKLKDSVVKCN